MNKLYLATRQHNVMFICSDSDINKVRKEAQHFLNEQDKCYDPPLELKLIQYSDQIPDDWKGGAFVWGTDEEISAIDFLKSTSIDNSEYQEYLRLKAKYE